MKIAAMLEKRIFLLVAIALVFRQTFVLAWLQKQHHRSRLDRQFDVLQLRPVKLICAFNREENELRRREVSGGLYAKNWDEIDLDDDETKLKLLGRPIARDMQYNPRNVKRQHEHFVDIRKVGGKEMTNDVYVRSSSATNVFWFVGKVARISDVTVQDAIARQWALIEIHACNLRPLDLFPYKGEMEIWFAPGDSEMDVAYNRPNIIFEKVDRSRASTTDIDSIKNSLVGFQGEVYQRGEEGFRTQRLDDGRPAKPEANSPSAETLETPTDEEFERIQKKLEGKDINAIYEEQQRRFGKDLKD